MVSEYNLKNKTVVITGASQGIGKSIALEFAKQKAHVIIGARTKEDLTQAKKEIEAAGGYCDAHVIDVSINAEVKKFFQAIIQKHQKIDVLICCAGIYGPLGKLENNDLEKWKKAIEINLLGAVYCVHAALPHMRKEKQGKIITLCGGGVGGNKLKPNLSAYISSKGAIALFTEVMSLEIADDNIQINAISPGAVNTRLLDEVLNNANSVTKDFLLASKEQKANGGTPLEKVTQLCLFLSSKKSDGITGKLISAVWDSCEDLSQHRDQLKNSDIYTLRRIVPVDRNMDWTV